jgi:NADH-quinone oxidoreductase subunit C
MNAASLSQAVVERFPEAVKSSHAYRGDATVILERVSLLEIARTLKEDPAFRMNFLMDLTAVDLSAFGQRASPAFFVSSGVAARPSTEIPDEDPWPGPPGPARFLVVYHLFSLPLKHRLRLQVPVEETDAEVDSVTSLWASADWLEREAWDMFGIRFRGHPNLKRILMYEEFVGHPLRKDYPVNKRQPLVTTTGPNGHASGHPTS